MVYPSNKIIKIFKFIIKLPIYIFKGYIHKTVINIYKYGLTDTKIKIKYFLNGGLYDDSKSFIQFTNESKLYFSSTIRKYEPIRSHTESVDIIICIHNALDDVKKCIESVFEYTTEPYNIIIVDDGSNNETHEYLLELENECTNIKLFRNEKAFGYTYAANIGLKASVAKFCMLLNSDTIVTYGWLDKIIRCQKSSNNIGIVGPLSNTASWQSVPDISNEEGDWAENKLPENNNIEQYSDMIEKYSGRIYPNIPLLNGFCLLINRSVIEKIGFFDEENFGSGYSEEDDYNIRACKAGFLLAVADDTFVYHAQSKSYSNEKRLALYKQNGDKLLKKHGITVNYACDYTRNNFIMEGIRERVRIINDREKLIKEGKLSWEGKSIIFLLPIKENGGGGNIIINEARIMMSMGINVFLLNISSNKKIFEHYHPDLDIPVIYIKNINKIENIISEYDAVCATMYTTVGNCKFTKSGKKPNIIYYVQDFEPDFYNKKDPGYNMALNSYKAIKDMKLVTKTNWNKIKLKNETGVDVEIIGKSFEIDLFRPRKMFPNKEKKIISAMIRPTSSRRSPKLTLDILNKVCVKYGDSISVYIFGSDPNQSIVDKVFWESNTKEAQVTDLGKINKFDIASLLSYTDIFVDFSSFQAMGLTTMEAMASGCGVIAPENGGSKEFINNGENGILVDTTNEKECLSVLYKLIENYELLLKISFNAIKSICEYYPEKCAYNILKTCFG